MIKPISAATDFLSRFPAELRDEVFVNANTLADARQFNAALGEGRDTSVWQTLVRAHLPQVLPMLPPEAQKILAMHVQASDEHSYSDCEAVWGKMDVDALTQAAATLADTDEAKALKPALLSEVLERYNKQFLECMGDNDRALNELSMLMLYQSLDNTLWEGELNPRLELCLDPGISKLPDILAGFDHVEHLILRRMPNTVDVSVMSRMRGLKTIELQYEHGATVGLPKGLEGKAIELVDARVRT